MLNHNLHWLLLNLFKSSRKPKSTKYYTEKFPIDTECNPFGISHVKKHTVIVFMGFGWGLWCLEPLSR
jgi:hypothetical protein